MVEKICPPEKILNPTTQRCVNRTGAIGKKLVESEQTAQQAPKPKNISISKPAPKPKPASPAASNSPISTQNIHDHIRVRQALSSSSLKAKLRGKLPKNALEVPELGGTPPSGIIKELVGKASELGILTEALLQGIPPDIVFHNVSEKTRNSKQTKSFLEKVEITRKAINKLLDGEKAFYEKPITQPGCKIVGHPDILSKTHIVEIKTSGRLKTSWKDFLLQSFSYAALRPEAKFLHIALPAQGHVWTYDLSKWKKRNDYLKVLKEYTTFDQNVAMNALQIAIGLGMGSHVAKLPTLISTVRSLEPISPYQIFLSMKSSPLIKDKDIAFTSAHIEAENLVIYAHAPYIFNLCNDDDWIVAGLSRHLSIATACGFKGLVVHVGKQKSFSKEFALENMKNNILKIVNSVENGLFILETPAAQGTEVLIKCEEFMNWVCDLNHPRVVACIDTCHVFAAGTQPDVYIEMVLAKPAWKRKFRLLHFNDSEADFDSGVDRHAMIGAGKIGAETLIRCARMANRENIDIIAEF